MTKAATALNALYTGALLRPLPHLAALRVSGEDRLSWLNGMLTCDVAKWSSGQGGYGLSVQKNGRIHSDLWIALSDDSAWLGVPQELAAALHAHMDHHLIMEDAEIELVEEPQAWWLAYGPKAEAVVTVARKEGLIGALGRYGVVDVAVVLGPRALVSTLLEGLLSIEGVVLAKPGEWEQIRVQHMFPRCKVDFDDNNYPQEAGLEQYAVSFDKGCYLGQEAVYMLQNRGQVRKRLVRLLLAPGVQLSVGDEVKSPDGEVVGKVSSWASVGDATMALAMVRFKSTPIGTELLVGEAAAAVSEPCSPVLGA